MISWLRNTLQRIGRQIADLFSAVVSPIERLIAGTFRGVFSAFERIEGGATSGIGLLVRLLTWPFRALASLCGALLPEPIVRAFGGAWSGLIGLGRTVIDSLLWVAEKLNLDWLIGWSVWLLQPIWRPLAAVGSLVIGWLVTREYRQALWAIPAVGLALVMGGVGLWHWKYGKSTFRSAYKTAAREALESRDFDRAQLYESKLAQLGVDTQLTRYRTALTLVTDDDLDEAYQRMQLLAPEDRAGYPAAHYWIAQQMLVGKLEPNLDEANRLAEAHLDHLQSLGIAGPSQQLLRAILLVRNSQFEEAAEVLEPLTPSLPNAAFERMRISLALKRVEEAKRDARALASHMSTRARNDGNLGPVEYQWWLAAEEVLGNVQQMRTILQQWLEMEPENAQARQSLAMVCRREAAQLLRDPLPDEKQIVELWLTAAEMDRSTDSLLKLAKAMFKSRQETPVFGRILEMMIESQRTPAELLVVVGTEAAIAQEYGEARQFFAAAVDRDGDNAVAWNNYGLVLGEGEDAQLEEALTAVDRALELAPDEHRFRETRGQILLRLERWTEAIDDLEFALNGLPNLDAIHKSLAEAYTALGEDDLASLHKAHFE